MALKPRLNSADIKLLEKHFATRKELKTQLDRTEKGVNYHTDSKIEDTKEQLLEEQRSFRSDFLIKLTQF